MRRSLLALAAGLALVVVVLLAMSGQSSDLSLAIGRLHPSVVHLPIGVLLVALAMDVAARWKRFTFLRGAVPFVLLVGAWCAIGAALVGLLLADGRGYDATTLGWHRALGLAIAVLGVVVYALRVHAGPGAPRDRRYPLAAALLLIALVLGGHLGGTLTHGDGYLTRHLPDGVRAIAGLPAKDSLARIDIANADSASVYGSLIQPIFDRRCASSCHSASRQKGGLALDSFQGMMKGGKDGKVIVPGRAEESELVRRIWLPPGHKDRMPPEDAITVAEAELIRWWIDRGARPEVTRAAVERPAAIRDLLDAYGLGDLPTGIFTLKVPAADSSAVAAVARTGLLVESLGRNAPYLQVAATNVREGLQAATLEALRPLAAQVAWVDLSGTSVGDSALAVLGTLPHLTRLHLENTRVSDAGLRHLAGLRYLEYLNLYGTQVSDTGLAALDSLSRLRSIYLWGTRVTPAGAAALKARLPRVAVSLGSTEAPVAGGVAAPVARE
jgi:uncharacterized membrane protein